MVEQPNKDYDEKAKEVQEAPGEGVGWQSETDGDQAQTEPADK